MSREIWNEIIRVVKFSPFESIDILIERFESKFIISKKENIEERKKNFALSLQQFKNDYPRELLLEFYRYWSEHSANGKKMRFEKEKVFDTKKRLERWGRNNKARKGKVGIEEMLSVNQLAKNGVSDTE